MQVASVRPCPLKGNHSLMLAQDISLDQLQHGDISLYVRIVPL